MFTPGCLYDGSTGKLRIATAADPTPAYFSGGFGFDSSGRLSVATGTPAGNLWNRGFRMSAKGAVYGRASVSVAYYCEGVAVDADGAINYTAASTVFIWCNETPFTATTGRVSIVNA